MLGGEAGGTAGGLAGDLEGGLAGGLAGAEDLAGDSAGAEDVAGAEDSAEGVLVFFFGGSTTCRKVPRRRESLRFASLASASSALAHDTMRFVSEWADST